MVRLTVEGSRLVPDAIAGLDRTFIAENDVLEELLFNRNLIGLEFTARCEEASRLFLQHFADELSVLGDDVAEYMLLSKGLYYWLHNAYARVFGRNLQANFAVTRRLEVSSGGVEIEIPYINVDAPANTLLIGDTIATGASICTALAHYIRVRPVRQVIVLSIAGTVTGARAIATFCNQNDITLTLAFGLACFGLAKNGFDLSFLHPDTITAEKYRRRAEAHFHGKPVSSVGWDFGSQAQAVRKYRMLCALEASLWDLSQSNVFTVAEFNIDRHLVHKEYQAFLAGRAHLNNSEKSNG